MFSYYCIVLKAPYNVARPVFIRYLNAITRADKTECHIDNTHGPSRNNYVSEDPYLIIYVLQRPNVLCIQPLGFICSCYVSHQTCICLLRVVKCSVQNISMFFSLQEVWDRTISKGSQKSKIEFPEVMAESAQRQG